MIKETLEQFDVHFSTEPIRTATYLMSDGSFLDSIELYQNGLMKKNKYDSPLHPDLDAFINSLLGVKERDYLLTEDAAIRLRDGSNISGTMSHIDIENAYIETKKAIKSSQFISLRKWLDIVMANKHEVIVYKDEKSMQFSLVTSNDVNAVIDYLR